MRGLSSIKNMAFSGSSSLHRIPSLTITPPSSCCLASVDRFPVLMLDEPIDVPEYIVLLRRRHHVTVIEPIHDLSRNPVFAALEHIHQPIHGQIHSRGIVVGKMPLHHLQLRDIGGKCSLERPLVRLLSQHRTHHPLEPVVFCRRHLCRPPSATTGKPVNAKSRAVVHLISRSRIPDLPPSSSLRRRVLSATAYSLHLYEPDTVLTLTH